jgi:hypothetical protein
MDQMTFETEPASRGPRNGRPAAPTMTTAQLMEALRASYGAPKNLADRHISDGTAPEILVEEVTAPGSNRRIDLVRIGLWQSRGHQITAYELKVSRSDWLRELEDPAKAEAWWRFCHQFYIVAPPGVVDPEELPEGWGLMVPPTGRSRTKKFRVVVKAEVRQPQVTPALVAAIVSRANNTMLARIDALNSEHRERMTTALHEVRQEQGRRALSHEDRERLSLLEALERGLGVKLSEYAWTHNPELREVTPRELSQALVDYVRDHISTQRRQERLHDVARQLGPSLDNLTAILKELTAEGIQRGRR